MANMQLFQDARNLMITGGSIYQTQQNYYGSGRDMGLHILRPHVATDAIYNSAERFPPPKCHPGTRERIIETIMKWINDPDEDKQALWLYGPAGAGKSAIAQSIAMLLQEIFQDRKYAASFFFAKDAPGRGDGNKLFSTIAYQLAIKFPSFRFHLDAIILDDPTLPTKSFDIQLRMLIVEPLMRVQDWPKHYPTVIIDGLDECSGSKRTQYALLLSLCKAITEYHIPLRFLIVSRPEYWISDCFNIGIFSGTARLVSLRDDLEADAGIKKYLREEFDRIYEENIALMSSVSLPWPSDRDVKRFVESASGQFVYASTVIKFVGDSSDFCDPRVQLDTLQKDGPHQASAFSELDKLYATILSCYPRLESLKCVLGGIILEFHENVIQEFLGVEIGEIRLIMRAINSLIHVNQQEYPEIYRALEPTFGPPPPVDFGYTVSFCHLSFYEFLWDQSRSGRYAVDAQAMGIQTLCSIIKHGCQMLQGQDDAEKLVLRIGLSNYRHLLQPFPLFFLQIIDIENLDPFNSVMDEILQADCILKTMLAQHPIRIPHAEHILWFSYALAGWTSILETGFHSQNLKKSKKDRERFISIKDTLETIMTLLSQQVLSITPNNMPTFAYLLAHTMPQFVYRGWDIMLQHGDHFTLNIEHAMGITDEDVILELQQLKDVTYVSFKDGNPRIHVITGVFVQEVYKLPGDHVNSWQRMYWDDLKICFIAGEAISFMEGNWIIRGVSGRTNEMLIYFLNDGRLSDIHSEDYFQDKNRMVLFNFVVANPQFSGTDPMAPSMDLIVGMLCWLNRQLTNTTSKSIIAEHDRTLLQVMQSAGRKIFETSFLPRITIQYPSTLCMKNFDDKSYVHLRVSTQLSDGKRRIIEDRHVDGDHSHYPPQEIVIPWKFYPPIHHMVNGTSGIIPPSDWYPHLAACLFAILVKVHYAILNKSFEHKWMRVSRKTFVPFLQCLPYAVTTEQNIEAIRALYCLWPMIDPQRRWRPPFGFCSLVTDFLMKYDPSSLSWSEFYQLTTWLFELKTYESKRIIVLDPYQPPPEGADSDQYTTDEDDDTTDDDNW